MYIIKINRDLCFISGLRLCLHLKIADILFHQNSNHGCRPILVIITCTKQTQVGLTLVVRHTHWAVTLVVGHTCPEGTVDGDLQVVGSQPMSVCVWVREETTLERDMGEDKTMFDWGLCAVKQAVCTKGLFMVHQNESIHRYSKLPH